VKRGRKTNPLKQNNPTFYHNLSNLYATLPEYAADPPDRNTSQHPTESYNNSTGTIIPTPSQFKLNKQQRKFLARQQKRQDKANLDDHIDQHIQWAEDERTDMERVHQSKGRLAVNALHHMPTHEPVSILQTGRNTGYAFSTTIRRAFQRLQHANHVHFNDNSNQIHFSTSTQSLLSRTIQGPTAITSMKLIARPRNYLSFGSPRNRSRWQMGKSAPPKM
jgi:hypothetical protein